MTTSFLGAGRLITEQHRPGKHKFLLPKMHYHSMTDCGRNPFTVVDIETTNQKRER
jgi:hypothetical protein